MKRELKALMVTGGSGFIGSNFIRFMLYNPGFQGKIINVDRLTYAGNPANLRDIEAEFQNKRYFFEQEDICDSERMAQLISKYQIDTIVNLAAESHVDRSVYGPAEFIRTNINGTFNLLEAARKEWAGHVKSDGTGSEYNGKLFHQVSTDEVFGSLEQQGRFSEKSPYDPHSPYSASKAAADHVVRASFHTFGLPVTISNCSNNYGPFQFPEKMIPLMLFNILDEKPLPVYGDGSNVRDWIYVEDHVRGIWLILQHGRAGESYNLGGDSELDNLTLVRRLCRKVAQRTGRDPEDYFRLIEFVKDRPGHDHRYAIDSGKIEAELGWHCDTDFEKGIELTIDWYLNHREWTDQIRKQEYRNWIQQNYTRR